MPYHGHGVTCQYGAHVQHGVVGHVGEDVDGGDDGHGDGDGKRKVPVKKQMRITLLPSSGRKVKYKKRDQPFGVFDLLSDKVEGVPA